MVAATPGGVIGDGVTTGGAPVEVVIKVEGVHSAGGPLHDVVALEKKGAFVGGVHQIVGKVEARRHRIIRHLERGRERKTLGQSNQHATKSTGA